ncbi:MAG: hypothetical protein HUJ98_05360 [Bacteroidaceae bacterium]|nr:hypothetical protein [Bacteroidaceae bacterium]
MNFEEFKEQLMEDLKAYLPNEIGEGVDVQANSVQKLQNESYEGIVVKKDSQFIGVNMNAEQLYSDLQQGKSYDDVFHYAIDIVQRGFEGTPQVDLTTLMNYELLKDTIMCQVIPVKGNEEMLSTLPHQQMEDIAVVYRFNVGRDDNGIASILINNEMLDRYGVTKEQLFADAEISAPLKEPVSIRTMTEVLMDMMGEEFGEFMGDIGAADAIANAPEMRPPVIKGMTEILKEMMGEEMFDLLEQTMQPDGTEMLYVATTPDKINGAGILAYPEFMAQAAEQLNGSFFVLPSSRHEVILVKDDGAIEAESLQAMVCQVNATEVSAVDKLTDSVYHYDCDSKVFELASDFNDRMMEKDGIDDDKGSVLKDLGDKKKEVADKPAKDVADKATKTKGGDAI